MTERSEGTIRQSTDLERFQHPCFARSYDRVSRESEARGTGAYRDRLLDGLTGRVIEIGAGNGLNFGHYPPEVTDVLAVEPEDLLRMTAEREARVAPVPVTVVPGHADALPAEDGAYDAAIVSLVLCSVPDPSTALPEIRRTLRPGGQLRFFEHVRSSGSVRGRLEDALTPLWSHLAGGCRLNRDLDASIRAAGFTIERLERFAYRPVRLAPRQTHILGVAT